VDVIICINFDVEKTDCQRYTRWSKFSIFIEVAGRPFNYAVLPLVAACDLQPRRCSLNTLNQLRSMWLCIVQHYWLAITGADCESLASANSSFDRASLTDDLESVQTRTSMASLRRRRLLMTSAPQFSARLRPKRCVVGQTVRFSCCVSGLPEPNVTWTRADGTTLTNSKRIHITVGLFS